MTQNTFKHSKLDHQDILKVIFHPRKENFTETTSGALRIDIPVEKDINIGASYFMAGKSDPNILYFHGNGEIAADYDTIGPMYNDNGMSLLAVDYRGYGRSDGNPTVTSMISDAHVIFTSVCDWLQKEDRTGPLIVMGRSLGCVSALEIAAVFQEEITALIIESGFSTTLPLLQTLGVDTYSLGITEADGFNNLQKISGFLKPVFIIHAQYDQLIPIPNAEMLQAQCPARNKQFQVVPGADHNSLISMGGQLYFEAIKMFLDKVQQKRGRKRYRK